MASSPDKRIDERAQVLSEEIRKLNELGLSFAASMVRIAYLDLQLRIHNVTEAELDMLIDAARACEMKR